MVRREKDLQESLKKFAGLVPAAASERFQGTLRHYQAQGLSWMMTLQHLGLGGILADDMGLGKTVQILSLISSRPMDKTSLIVMPRSLLFNWQAEGQRFVPDLKILIHSGPQRDRSGSSFHNYHLVLTTYGTLQRDVVSWRKIHFDYCILDESQAIKNAQTANAKAVRLILAQHRLALSGTPVENHLGELVSQFEFLNPGLLGRSAWFKNWQSKAEGEELVAAVSQGIRPLVLRRTKEQVAKELPPKTEQVLFCDMTDEQQRHYEELPFPCLRHPKHQWSASQSL